MKTIVISAVNLKVGGTLVILKGCLEYLSELSKRENYRVLAIVYKKELANYPNIEYIETQWPKKRWINRLWFEYVSLKQISNEIGPVYLWFSLHDTSPTVSAHKRAVYCHNSFPFYKWKWQEMIFAPKIVLFALFSKFIYKKNINQNNYIVVQQQWLKRALKRMFEIDESKLIVAAPSVVVPRTTTADYIKEDVFTFFYPAAPDSHKNFECLCKAAEILETKDGLNFKVYLTIEGPENSYTKWLAQRWKGKIQALNFIGYLDKPSLNSYYRSCGALVFPSKVETWGLPISEFGRFKKPMLLADLPYAHETASGVDQVAFFNPEKPAELAGLMRKLINGTNDFLHKGASVKKEGIQVENWEGLFDLLLREEHPTISTQKF